MAVWEQQADALFVGHTVEHVRASEIQIKHVYVFESYIRSDIEKKKEELRQMVG